jgi:hypothetical protein
MVASTGASGIALGAFPAEVESLDRVRWSGSKGLLRGFTRDAAGATYGEILFADTGSAGSLVRVTSTPSISEALP